jgi:hypothetical protein
VPTTVAVSSLDERLTDLRKLVEEVLADPPATKLDLKRLLAPKLGIDPRPEFLQGFSACENVFDPTGREIAVRALVVHLAVETTLAEAWGTHAWNLDLLRRSMEWMPLLAALQDDEESKFAAAIGAVDRTERDAVRKLRTGVVLAKEPLHAVRVIVPELEHLATAVREGRLGDAAASLDADETEIIAITSTEAVDAARPDREAVDAIALRTLIERDLGRWLSLPPAEPDDDAAEEARRELRDRLEAESEAHGVVSPRLDALRSRRFQEAGTACRHLDQVRRKLFATFLDLKRTLAGGHVEPADEIRERISEAEAAAAVIDADRETTENLMRDATAPGDQPKPLAEIAPDFRDLIRERRRKKILIWIAAALVPVAVGTNLFLGTWRWKKVLPTTEEFGKAMPLQEVLPMPGVLYSQVSSLLWETMGDAERRSKVEALGRMARRKGFNTLVLVDENHRDLARVSVAGGTEILTGKEQALAPPPPPAPPPLR